MAKPAAKGGLSKKRPASALSGKTFGTAAKKTKTLSSGWQVVQVPRGSRSGRYEEWFSPDGVFFRTKGEAMVAGFVEE